MISRLLAVATLALACTLPALGQGDGLKTMDPLPIREIMKRMESSKTKYNVLMGNSDSIARVAAGALFRQQQQPVRFPKVENGSEGFMITETEFDPAAMRSVNAGKEHMTAGRFDQAKAAFEEALKLSPGCYPALAALGELSLERKDPAAAVGFFDRAIAISRDDHELYVGKGRALAAQGKPADAAEACIDALVLRPRDPGTLKLLKEVAAKAKLTVRDSLFVPRAIAVRSGDAVNITIPTGDMMGAWMGYGSAKGFWLGEPEHRREVLGSSEYEWTSAEEGEALLGLLESYLATREDKRDKDLDRMVEVTKDGMLHLFVVYEISSRIDPNITLPMDESLRSEMRAFITKYVVVKG